MDYAVGKSYFWILILNFDFEFFCFLLHTYGLINILMPWFPTGVQVIHEVYEEYLGKQ